MLQQSSASDVPSSSSSLSWKEILMHGYTNDDSTLSEEEIQESLVVMLRNLFKILPLRYQKKGLFSRSVQAGIIAQILGDCICKVLLGSSSATMSGSENEQLVDYIGKLMTQMKIIEFDGGQDGNAASIRLSQDRKKIVRFLHPYLPRLVIVGGGHAGLMSAIQLHEYFSIILVDKNEYCSLKPGYPTVVEDVNESEKISVKYSEVLPENVTFVRGVAKLVKPDGVFIEPLLLGNDQKEVKHLFSVNNEETRDDVKNCKYLTFDYLVLSTGCNAWRNVPNYDNNGGSSAEVDNKIVYVDSYNMDMIKVAVSAIQQSDDSKSVVVIGGGIVGSEFFGSLAQSFPNKEIYLIQRSDMLMKPCLEAHKVAIETFGKMKNAHVLLNSQVTHQLDSETLVVKSSESGNETSIKCCVCILASGNTPNTSFMKEFFSQSLEEGGYLKVNSSFQLLKSSDSNSSEYFNNIFVLGDINNLDPQKLMQNANIQSQKFVEIAKVIVQLQTGSKLPTYETDSRVMAISLGPKYGFVMRDNKILFKSGVVNTVKGVIQFTTMKGYNKYSKK